MTLTETEFYAVGDKKKVTVPAKAIKVTMINGKGGPRPALITLYKSKTGKEYPLVKFVKVDSAPRLIKKYGTI